MRLDAENLLQNPRKVKTIESNELFVSSTTSYRSEISGMLYQIDGQRSQYYLAPIKNAAGSYYI